MKTHRASNYTNAELLAFSQAIEQHSEVLFDPNRNSGPEYKKQTIAAWKEVVEDCVGAGHLRFAEKSVKQLRLLWTTKRHFLMKKYASAANKRNGKWKPNEWETIILGLALGMSNAENSINEEEVDENMDDMENDEDEEPEKTSSSSTPGQGQRRSKRKIPVSAWGQQGQRRNIKRKRQHNNLVEKPALTTRVTNLAQVTVAAASTSSVNASEATTSSSPHHQRQTTDEEGDEDGMYMKSMTAFMRRLPPRRKAQFRFKLEELKYIFSEDDE